jgi:hypothetical protein
MEGVEGVGGREGKRKEAATGKMKQRRQPKPGFGCYHSRVMLPEVGTGHMYRCSTYVSMDAVRATRNPLYLPGMCL